MIAPAARASCTHSWHHLLRANADSFERETVPPVYFLEDGGVRFKVALCRSCGSSIAIQVSPEARR